MTDKTHITILQTADLHGQLETHDEFYLEDGQPVYRRAGGVARMKTLLRADPGGESAHGHRRQRRLLPGQRLGAAHPG